jgi:hypothetical protein
VCLRHRGRRDRRFFDEWFLGERSCRPRRFLLRCRLSRHLPRGLLGRLLGCRLLRRLSRRLAPLYFAVGFLRFTGSGGDDFRQTFDEFGHSPLVTLQIADLAALRRNLIRDLVQHRLALLALSQQLGMLFLLAGFAGRQLLGLLPGVGDQRLLAVQGGLDLLQDLAAGSANQPPDSADPAPVDWDRRR